MSLERLGTGSINKLVFEFAIPSVISITLSAVYNIIDAIFLGNVVGDVGIAATQAAAPLSMLITTIVCLPGMGGITLVAIYLGSGKRRESELVLGNTATYSLLLSVVFTVAGLVFLEPILTLSGTTPQIMPEAKLFMGIICLGTVFQGLFLNLNNFIRTAGNPRRALFYNGLGMLLCIVFNFLFVVVLGWGVAGSAVATIAGQAVSAYLICSYFFSKGAVLRLRLRDLMLSRAQAGRIWLLGVPMSVAQLIYSLATFVLNNLFVLYGAASELGSEGSLAAVGVIARVGLFISFILFGVNIGVQPILGYNYGAGKTERLRKTFWTAVLWTSVISLSALALLVFFPRQVVGIFGLGEGFVGITSRLLTIYVLFLPLGGFAIMAMDYFQAVGKAGRSMLLSVFKQGLLLLPLLVLLPRVLPGLALGVSPLEAVVWAAPVADALAFATSLVLMSFEFRKRKDGTKEQATAAAAEADHS
jgi:putative MATE family efflux protein